MCSHVLAITAEKFILGETNRYGSEQQSQDSTGKHHWNMIRWSHQDETRKWEFGTSCISDTWNCDHSMHVCSGVDGSLVSSNNPERAINNLKLYIKPLRNRFPRELLRHWTLRLLAKLASKAATREGLQEWMEHSSFLPLKKNIKTFTTQIRMHQSRLERGSDSAPEPPKRSCSLPDGKTWVFLSATFLQSWSPRAGANFCFNSAAASQFPAAEM